jgi:hypothetical protein
MFKGHDDGALPGLSDLVPSTGKKPTLAKIKEYTRSIQQADLPLEPTMGFGDWSGFIERLFFRKLVRELSEQNCSLPWFQCHVPPAGTTSVESGVSVESDSSIGLKIFGSGLGRGRKVSISVSSKSEARLQCAEYRLDLRVKPRVFASHGTESIEVEVLEYMGDSAITYDRCPFCGRQVAAVDPMDYRFGPHIDLRRDKSASTRTFKFAIEDSSSIEVGFQAAAIPVELKLDAKVTKGTTLEVESVFPPGFRYLPCYRVTPGGPLHTAMWAIEK